MTEGVIAKTPVQVNSFLKLPVPSIRLVFLIAALLRLRSMPVDVKNAYDRIQPGPLAEIEKDEAQGKIALNYILTSFG